MCARFSPFSSPSLISERSGIAVSARSMVPDTAVHVSLPVSCRITRWFICSLPAARCCPRPRSPPRDAAIVGHDGTTWACSPGYTVLPEEAKSLATLLSSTSLESIAGPGFGVAGQRYAFTRGEVDDDEGGVVRLGCFRCFGGEVGGEWKASAVPP
eukprot:TRINITY_DN18111_c0_g1_i1.p1 TRINITY_DN18111_c0_g1~~TRINITY_DN18111_c0_g1_i1.p1  ORF type:complete len:156 (+),score=4.71 TRINITY_DN18111_c0_g1_i1:224-691(+)